MKEENISQQFRLKNIEEIKIYFIREIDQSELITKKHKKLCKTLNYIEHILIFAFLMLLGVFPFLLLLRCLLFLQELRVLH